jgi:branched-chain amino acid aminotransferase
MSLEERPISLEEIAHRAKQNELTEVFGSGTAAVIAPVEELASSDGTLKIRPSGTYKISTLLLNELTKIQREQQPDRFGWVKKVELERS